VVRQLVYQPQSIDLPLVGVVEDVDLDKAGKELVRHYIGFRYRFSIL
jgi:hypothetical protein